MAHQALFGDTLMKAGEKVSTADALKGKIVGIYFSAHWCPPCRGFTPLLADYYKAGPENFEIVFVSSDQDQAKFDEYYGEMPWLALPYTERSTKGDLSSKYNVTGIPTLVIIDEAGEMITKDGRTKVQGCPESFPWK